MKARLLLFAAALLAAPILKAQVSQGGRPLSFSRTSAVPVATKTVAALSLRTIQEEDAHNEKQGLPLRIGIIVPTDYSLQNSGTWETLANGDRIWRLRIAVQGALATSLYYKGMYLPEGSRLFVYNPERTQLIGAFTAANNQETGLFATEVIKGSDCIIEYYEPVAVSNKGRFTISGVNHVYSSRIPEGRAAANARLAASGSCNVNVNCPEGVAWQKQKRSVARIVFRLGSSSYLCSGALVNNARRNCKPYFLTANHCGSDASEADFNQWIFYFNYESPTCSNPATEPPSNTITGCVQRARAGDNGRVEGSDFQLVEFKQAVPQAYNVYYAGWNANVAASPSGVSIHHPAGDIKKISTYSTPLVASGYNTPSTPPYTHWKAAWVQTVTNWSVTEGGSSGSPLFNNQGEVVGQLSGGPSSCGASASNKVDYYGQFAQNWTSNGTDNLHQLKPWLDPDNTGILQLNGADYPCTDTSNPQTCPDPYEPNNSIDSAAVIFAGAEIRAKIGVRGDQDYYKINIADSSDLRVTLDNLPANYNLRLLSANGAVLATSTQGGTVADSIFRQRVAGTFIIQVYGNTASDANDSICYRLVAAVIPVKTCEDQLEPNNTQATAAVVRANTSFNAQISSASDVDYYQFTTTGTTNIDLTLDRLPADYDIRLLSSTGAQLASSQQGDVNTESISYATAAAGTYYVYIYGYNGAYSDIKCYRLNITTTPVTGCADAYEPNNTQATAAGIPVDSIVRAQIASASDVDWYSISTTTARPHIEISLSNLPKDYDVYLYNAAGTQLVKSENAGTTSERIVYNNGAVGKYYIRVIGYSGAFSNTQCYQLVAALSATPKQAVVSKYSKSSAGEDNRAGAGLHVYPVPARDRVFIELSSKANVLQRITVTDVSGKVVYDQRLRVATGHNKLEILLPQELKDGVYIISTDNEPSRKFILKR
ncbi:pre-peptidase C-terminal domain-containing protein [Chitinophaga pendula]|uniref:pre-peptidase C-terminal domain-containing protein n=1 Tax=Chitinophaga TaxID=79328 RepID=UPI000BAFA5D4|nr:MULTISPECIES: pre-peptidase C-terminal domain-containing protein [Chitinophaga]ASZ10266.1 hypothetical protein CK934_04355 [Chitinophaga sp. MD30]UCJ06776.1 pre-peptidase C-terminal domain-containing protein [Chitinophaga pendula]